jgi:ribonuclease VapC
LWLDSTFLEASMIGPSPIGGTPAHSSWKGPAGGRELDMLLHSARIEVASMTLQQVDIAREAYRRYGKGRHPAKLNMGDCCSYALARHSGERLLFKGEDFSQLDIPVVALPS